MKRIGIRLFAVLVFFAAMFGQANAVVIISYSDIGSDLVFNYSGSLNTAIAPGSFFTQYATIGIQGSSDPTFYSASSGYRNVLTPVNYLGPNNPGLFATNAPSFVDVMPGSSSSGTSFMVRLNNATSGSGTTSVDLYGNWGAANAPIVGVLTIANQSIASMGMVNGYTIQTDAGDIIFQQAVAGAPELDAARATLPLMILLSMLLLVGDHNRRDSLR